MTPMQKELYRGRTLACNNCAKTFSADGLTPVTMEIARPWSPAVPRADAATPPGQPMQPGQRASPAPPAPARRSGGWVVALLTVGGAVVIVGLLLALLVPPLNRAREQSRRVSCAGNMRKLGSAMMIYASVNGGQFPDRFDRLLAYVPSNTMVCPSTGHTPAVGATPQVQAADLAKGGHLSFVYVGDTYNTKSTANGSTTVVLYEPLGNHRDGTNVLYADGHVAYLARAQAIAQIPGIATAVPNPAGPATAPASQAAPAP
jgi:prepilin-type processing-associated H-X9-DG protein